jgi:hypothetical protein
MAEAKLSVEQAVQTIARVSAYEAPLRRRTEGVTWMVWGLVTAGLVASGSALERYGVPFSNPVYELYPFLWLAAGIVATKAVWSIAGVSLPPTKEGARRTALAIALAIVVTVAVWTVALVAVPISAAPAFILIGLATPWVVLGTINPHRATRAGRLAMIASGAALFATAFAMLPYLPSDHDAGFRLMEVLGTFVGCGAPFVAGAVQALRG